VRASRVRALRARRSVSVALVVLGGVVPAAMSKAVSASASGADSTAYVTDSGDGTVTPFDTTSGFSYPPITVGPSSSTPWAVAFSPAGGTAYVVLRFPFAQNGEVVPVEVANDAVGSPIAVGATPWGIALTPDGHTAYVTNFGSSTVTPVDLVHGTAGTPISLPAGSGPRGIAITPDGSTAYVADYSSDQVTPIKLPSGIVESAISVGSQPTSVAVTPNGSFVDVVNHGDGTVTPIATASNTAGTPFAVGRSPSQIALAPNGSTAYVSDYDDGGFMPIGLGSQQAGNEVVGVAAFPLGIAVSPDGSTVYLSDYLNAQVVRVTLGSNALQAPIGTGGYPSSIAVDPVPGILPPTPPSTPTGASGASPTTTVAASSTTVTVPVRRQAPSIRILSSATKVSSHHVKLELSCTVAACSGTVTVSAKVVVSVGKGRKRHHEAKLVEVARTTFSIAKNHHKTIKLKLTAKGSRLLAKARKHPVEGEVSVRIRGGGTASRPVHLS
jgi:DNA-binding beta-propeller fold protein YncE